MKYVLVSEFFESSSLFLWMKSYEKKDVKIIVTDKEHRKILDGLIDKEDAFVQYLGDKNLFITDDASSGKLADSLRAKGELVFGGSVASDRMENERAYGQKTMKDAGINTVQSVNFKGHDAFDRAIAFVKKTSGRWVVKQNGDADKALSTVGKFNDGTDVIDKLMDFKHLWVENIDFDLQEFVDGYEVAIEGWFNGKDWVKDRSGEPVFIVNWEHKKKSEGDTGRTTGETGTLAYRTRKDAGINKELTKITPLLQKIKYIGNVDINFILSKKEAKFYGLEYTMRFGYPALNYFQEMCKTPFAEVLEKCARGENNFLEVDPSWAVVVVVQVPPFPFMTNKETENARGSRIYLTKNGNWMGKDDLSYDKLKHTHFYEVRYDKETKRFICSGDTGYLMTVTAQGDSPKTANDKCLKFIKDNIYVSNMDFRKDIGVGDRIKESIEFMQKNKFL